MSGGLKDQHFESPVEETLLNWVFVTQDKNIF